MTPTKAFHDYCDAFASGDHLAMAALFTEDGIFEASSMDAPVCGQAELRRELRIISNSSRDIKTQIRIALEDGDIGHFEGTYEAEIIGTGGKIDGSPNRIDFKFSAVVEMENGKISRLCEIFDTRPLHPEERQRVWTLNRRTAYWDGTVAAKCKEWSVYNNMYFPMIYSRTPYEDYCALLEKVTLWDVGLERQTQLKGPDAHAFLDYLCCRDMSGMKPGDCLYGMVSDDHGQIMSDPVVLWPWEDTIWLSHGSTELTLWARGIVLGSDWDVEVCEPDVSPLQIQGPQALEVMQKICDDDLAGMKNYSCIISEVAGKAAVVSRTGWSGGPGFEVYPLGDDGAMNLWQAILQAGDEYGIKVTGPIINRAIERGVTDTCYHGNSGMNALEDLGARFVDLDGDVDYIGKQALLEISKQGVQRRSVGLIFDAQVPRLEWYWDAIDAHGRPGLVRWATYSFALEKYIGIGLVDRNVGIGDVIKVEHPHGHGRATVCELPFVDRTG
ncbi:MAG: glycine cleavage system aminomethyltransferase T/ketosteroid isomerase-like protein [Gammaproteobacteria bacterium]|jgi:glycine cleavage system aminomethyltransferase T/ketosteroid isomerase-like protein